MKRFYSFLLALAALVGVVNTAWAVDFTLNVDDAAAIRVTKVDYLAGDWDEVAVAVVNGNNTITIGEDADIMIYANDGYAINSVTHNGNEDTTPSFENWYICYGMTVSTSCQNITYTVSTTNLSAGRTDSVLVWIDDVNGADLSYANGNSAELVDSQWVAVYYSSADLPLKVEPAAAAIYEVLHNNQAVAITLGDWSTYDHYVLNNITCGDSIKISVHAPADITVPVYFDFADTTSRAALDSVLVNDVKVTLADTIIVPWGATVKSYFNITDFGVKVNGSSSALTKWTNPSKTSVYDTTTIAVNAVRYQDIDITVRVHNPSCAKVQYYAPASGSSFIDMTGLQDGVDTTVTLSNNNLRFMISAVNNDCKIDSVLVNGEKTTNYSSLYLLTNTTIEVFADSVRRDKEVVVYIEDKSAFTSIRLNNKAYTNFLPTTSNGYNSVLFDPSIDNTFSLQLDPKGVIYYNDVPVTYGLGTSITYYTFADGDVLKIYTDSAAAYTVDFTNLGATITGAKKDRIVAIEDFDSTYTVLEGTEISFATEAEVLVNGVAATATDGVYTITINENTDITIGSKISCAEANVAADKAVVALKDFVVAYVNGAYTYIQDETGSALIYKYNFGLNPGDTVSGLVGEISVYNGLVEIVPSVTVADLTVRAGVAPAPASLTATITEADINRYVVIDSVAIVGEFTTSSKTSIKGVWNGTDTITFYNQFKIAQSFSADSTYNIVCAVSIYKSNLQVYFISAEANAIATIEPDQPEGIFNTRVNAEAEKFIRNGEVIIRIKGEEYNVIGTKIQ